MSDGPATVHYEDGGERGVPRWNTLAFALCGAALYDDRGYTTKPSTRDEFLVTCSDCQSHLAKRAERAEVRP